VSCRNDSDSQLLPNVLVRTSALSLSISHNICGSHDAGPFKIDLIFDADLQTSRREEVFSSKEAPASQLRDHALSFQSAVRSFRAVLGVLCGPHKLRQNLKIR
jgi:hypothetical protein